MTTGAVLYLEEVPSDMGELSLGVIGMGRHGSRYINHILNDVKGARLGGVCRSDPAKAEAFTSEHPDIRVFPDADSLFSSGDVEAVVVATPTFTHEGLAVKAMEAGLDVLLEKPMAGSLEACRNIIDTADRTGRKLMLAHTLRYDPVYNALKESLKNENEPSWFEVQQRLEPPKTHWLMDREQAQGGCVLNTGVHVFDTMRYVFDGEISRMECRTMRIINPVWEDYAYGTITMRGGLEGNFKITRDSNFRARILRVDFEGGLLYGDSLEFKLTKLS
ncbi:MAG: Gfo/Idh/MocA family protein, partial [Thermoplasmatota archaeon]